MTGGREAGQAWNTPSLPKYARVVASIRAQIAEGALSPGQPAPSGAALARATGYSVLTCRKAIRVSIREGILVPGASPNARPRVAGIRRTSQERARAEAARALSACLAARRHAEGWTQPELAGRVGVSTTTIGHAETGRVWQSRRFWKLADKALSADGELLRLHDAYCAAVVVPPADGRNGTEAAPGQPAPDSAIVITASPVILVTIQWADGTTTTVRPPHSGQPVLPP